MWNHFFKTSRPEHHIGTAQSVLKLSTCFLNKTKESFCHRVKIRLLLHNTSNLSNGLTFTVAFTLLSRTSICIQKKNIK